MNIPRLARRMLAVMAMLGLGTPLAAAPLLLAGQGRHAFRTVQAAIDALPATGGEIRIAPGTYREKIRIAKPDVHLTGTGARPDDVVLVYDDSSITVGNTYATPSVQAAGDGFHADNLTIANDWNSKPGRHNAQAVALAVTGDRAVLRHVRILGGQDTLYLAHLPGQPSRQYFEDCYIEGHVDFVFGNAKAYFRNCELHGLERGNVMFTAQSRNAPDEDSAFVFDHCRLTSFPAAGGVFLGRAWRPYARVIFLDTRMDAPIHPDGWREWYPNKSRTLETAYYAEYRSQGPGASPATRERFSHQLSDAEAAQWRLDAFFKGDTGWIAPAAR